MFQQNCSIKIEIDQLILMHLTLKKLKEINLFVICHYIWGNILKYIAVTAQLIAMKIVHTGLYHFKIGSIWYVSGVILQILNREKFWLFSVILKRILLEYSFYRSYVKPPLPELKKGRSVTVLGENFSHVSLQDDPCVYVLQSGDDEEKSLQKLFQQNMKFLGDNGFNSGNHKHKFQ